MPTYRGLKTVFVHIPKTAGSGIANRLYTENLKTEQDSLEYEKHESILNVKSYLGESDFRNYFKFAVVRNPYDRLVSWYHYYQELWGGDNNDRPACNPEHIKEFLSWDFDEYVANIKEWPNWDCTTEVACPHFAIAPQYKYIIGYGNFVLVDLIARVEFLKEDWKHISERLGMEYAPLERVNATRHKHWSEYYSNPKTINRVLELYGKDFDYFDYSREIPELNKKTEG
jgi:chondroitin 4-sulfotransferase 11